MAGRVPRPTAAGRRARARRGRAWRAASTCSTQLEDLLVQPDEPDDARRRPARRAGRHRTAAEPPDDPVLARLLPDAYPDDPEAAGRVPAATPRRRCASARRGATRRSRARRAAHGAGRVVAIAADASVAWLGALNDLRLMLGTRLGVDRGPGRRTDAGRRIGRTTDRRAGLLQVYDWLGFLPGRPGAGRWRLAAVAGRPLALPMLVIGQDLVDAIVAHARRDHPDEACGVVAGPAGTRPARAVHPHGQRRPLAHVLRVRLDGPAAALPRDGRPRRGAGGHLPLAHRHRGVPVAHRHLLRLRAERPLRAGVDPGAGTRRARRAPLVPHRGRRGRPRKTVERASPTLAPPAGDRWRSRCRAPTRTATPRSTTMAVEVRIPTILRTYTDGEKTVDGVRRHARGASSTTWRPPPRASRTGSSTTAGCAASSTSTSTTRTCASSTASTPRSPTATR